MLSIQLTDGQGRCLDAVFVFNEEGRDMSRIGPILNATLTQAGFFQSGRPMTASQACQVFRQALALVEQRNPLLIAWTTEAASEAARQKGLSLGNCEIWQVLEATPLEWTVRGYGSRDFTAYPHYHPVMWADSWLLNLADLEDTQQVRYVELDSLTVIELKFEVKADDGVGAYWVAETRDQQRCRTPPCYSRPALTPLAAGQSLEEVMDHLQDTIARHVKKPMNARVAV